MDETDVGRDISDMTTLWGLVNQANRGPEAEARRARERLLVRYKGAVQRYLLGALHDPDAAEDLAQDFFLRFVRGDFKNADPQKGRFRDLLKTSLYHLIVDHQRRQKGGPQPLPPEDVGPAIDPKQVEEEFRESWRKQLLSQAWKALRERDGTNYAVLRLRAEQNDLSAAEMAQRLGGQLGRAVTPEWVRQRLHRSREQFAALLLDELAQSLEQPTRESLEEELAELRLLSYCRDAVARWGKSSG